MSWTIKNWPAKACCPAAWLLLFALFSVFQGQVGRPSSSELSYSEFLDNVEQGKVKDVNVAGSVKLGCNIHDQMRGYIRVTDTPFAGKTGDRPGGFPKPGTPRPGAGPAGGRGSPRGPRSKG